MLFTREKHLHDHILSLRGEASLLFIGVTGPESERSGTSILPTNFLLNFGTAPTMVFFFFH